MKAEEIGRELIISFKSVAIEKYNNRVITKECRFQESFLEYSFMLTETIQERVKI